MGVETKGHQETSLKKVFGLCKSLIHLPLGIWLSVFPWVSGQARVGSQGLGGCHPSPSWHGVSELHIHAGNHSLVLAIISFPRI